ncbi:protein of unknown function (DUF1707) [Streptoalloteichus tenebrarius]|uniref:DUF1707 domain-containing protein n=1 Tax=Streptoalloteichus tenebrarius (strain ATCC 17920 / DSM 40477 / JCM 4838 / CBS 697.72 / NBRC 16177 / NCIMB 11028 / NRRL B-12390 / A12253. 1 / ISP 5477) TaxID=1933 RepID=A0ABT1HXI3_STRSD|nr:protein of unknown function (DUF1707) [Streptoalloteichus tenebrarius]BFF02572.1 hypothetical protein GCM10020241_42470 [Streptoalloteichus tenebrarius]
MQDRPHAAHAQGLIDLAEFDTRVRTAWDAKTRGELERVVADLPAPRPAGPSASRVAMTVLTRIWLCLVAFSLALWGLLVLTMGWTYPVWVWFVAPGAVLGVLWASGVGRDKER